MQKRRFSGIALFIAAVFISVIGAEFILRLVLPEPMHWSYPQESYELDNEIGFRLRSNQSAYTHDKPVKVNTLGVRDSDYPPFADPAVTRIVAIGDSQTFGNGLALDETWPKQLKSVLEGRTGSTWEVINSGLPGSDTWQHRVILERMLDAYHPDVVVLAFYVNDVSRHYVTELLPSSGMTNSTTKRMAYLLKESALFLTVHQAYNAVRNALSPSPSVVKEMAILTGTTHPGVAAGWRQVEESIAGMKSLTDARGVQFVIVVLPRRDQVVLDHPPRAYNDRILTIAENNGISAIDVLPALQEAFPALGKDLFIPWDGHNSAAANRIIAEAVGEFFLDGEKNILIKQDAK